MLSVPLRDDAEPLLTEVEPPEEARVEVFLPIVSFPVVFLPPKTPDPTYLVGIELGVPAPLMPDQGLLYRPPPPDDLRTSVVAIPLPNTIHIEPIVEKHGAEEAPAAEEQTPDDEPFVITKSGNLTENAADSSDTGPVFEPIEERIPRRPAVTRAERTITAGQRFSISLRGTGWIFLGSSMPVDFIGRERFDDEVVFTFRSRVPTAESQDLKPVIELSFEMQDLTAGDRYRHEEQVMLAPPRRVGDSAIDTEPPSHRSDEVEPAGQAEVLPLNQRIRNAAEREGSLTSEDETLLREILDEGVEDPYATLAFVERLVTAPVGRETIELLEALLEQGSPRYDFILFSLARLYEEPGIHRDLKRSHDLYTKLTDEYPLSEYWERANARIEYLERHFFYIR